MNDKILRDDGMEDANVNVDDNIQNEHANIPSSDEEVKIPTMKVIPLKKICMTIGQLPTAYIETMSYYEMLVWFIEFLRNNIIPTVNNNGEAVQELQTIVMTLQNYINTYKQTIDEEMNNFQEAVNTDILELEDYMNNYFNNLDVQEEINNKLDQMLEDGVLEQIIEQFLQSTAVWCFDNVADMKLATNLTNGSYAKTLGFYSANDGGGATYKIITKTDETPDNSLIIQLNDTSLIAILIINLPLNVRQAGLKEDIDCSNLLQNIINNNIENLYFPKGTYEISKKITTKNIYWNLDNNAEIKATDTMTCMISINKNATSRIKNMYIKGGIINGNEHADICLGLNNSQYFRFEDIFITNFLSNGIEFDEDSYAGNSGGSFVKNCVFWGLSDNANENGINLKTSSDCHIIDCVFKDCKTALYIRGGNIKVVGCHAWCNTETKYIESKFADIATAGRTTFDHCVIDTMQYGVYGGHTIIFTSLINTIFINRSEYGENNIPFIVYSETSFNNYSGININGLLIAANSGKVKIISDSLLNRSDLVQYQSYSGLADYPPESHVEVLNNPGNTCSFSYKTSSASVLNKSSNFDNLTLSLYQLNMFTGDETGTNIPGTDFTGILYNIVNNTTNNYKNNGFQIVFTSTGKIISRYKKSNSWTTWNAFNKDA